MSDLITPEKNYYTLDEIYDYNVCPKQYYLQYILGYTKKDLKMLLKNPLEIRNRCLIRVMKNCVKESITWFFNRLNRDKKLINLYTLQEFYSNLFYKDCSLTDIFETELSSLHGTPVFSEGLNLVNTFYNEFKDEIFSPIIVNKTYEIDIKDKKIRGTVEAIIEKKFNNNKNHSLEIIHVDDSSYKLSRDSHFFYSNNLYVDFVAYLLRHELETKEDRITVFSFGSEKKKTFREVSDNSLSNFENLIVETIENIENNNFSTLCTRKNCNGCPYFNICQQLL